MCHVKLGNKLKKIGEPLLPKPIARSTHTFPLHHRLHLGFPYLQEILSSEAETPYVWLLFDHLSLSPPSVPYSKFEYETTSRL